MRPLRTLFTIMAALAIGLPFAACGPQRDEFTETPPTQEQQNQRGSYEGSPDQYQQNGGMTQPRNGGAQSPSQRQSNGGLQQQPSTP